MTQPLADRLRRLTIAILACVLLAPEMAFAGSGLQLQDFTIHWASWLAVGIFILAYMFVIAKEATHLRKSKPTMVAAGFIWGIVALLYIAHGDTHTAELAVKYNLEELGELFLFLLAAMTFTSTTYPEYLPFPPERVCL